jgi:hypothetical protein
LEAAISGSRDGERDNQGAELLRGRLLSPVDDFLVFEVGISIAHGQFHPYIALEDVLC